jgi:hypothetical protein
MTPQERKLIDELFDRLASLERNPRDPDAVRAINEGLQRAPNALYPLVQTALVQDEALKRADARIRELERSSARAGRAGEAAGFLDNMRDACSASRRARCRRCGRSAGRSPWRTPRRSRAALAGAPAGGSRRSRRRPDRAGGSFLGTAAATAAGVVGGALLMNSFRGMFGGHNQGQSAFDSGRRARRAVGLGCQRQRSRPRRRLERHRRGGRSAAMTTTARSARAVRLAAGDSDFDGGEIDVGGDFGGDGGSDSA